MARPHTILLTTAEQPGDFVRLSDRSPEYYIGRLRFEEGVTQITEQQRLLNEQAARYDGLFGDVLFLKDVLSGVEKIGLEIPEETQYQFADGEIGRWALLTSARLIEGEL